MLSWPVPRSLWLAQIPTIIAVNPVRHDMGFDIAIAGGGYSALWTAYYLKKADATLKIGIFEAKFVGFGASGRNGGWASALFPSSHAKVAKLYGHESAVNLHRALVESVYEIAKVVQSEGIQADLVRGGTVTVAGNVTQLARLQAQVNAARLYGDPNDEYLLSAEETLERVGVASALGGTYTPHCARIQPAKLVRGLLEVVRGLGVEVFENSVVSEIKSGLMTVNGRSIRADIVIDAMEGYRSRLLKPRSPTVPIYSLMIATKSLSDAVVERVGLRERETLTDGRNLIIYAQRTADNRIVFGGRGALYHFGASVSPEFDDNEQVFDHLELALADFIPSLQGVEIEYKWGGPLGVSRDFFPFVRYFDKTSIGSLGGYVGDGVTMANLAGRTLADLITARDTDLAKLCIVNHKGRNYEAEPLRYLGINSTIIAADRLDKNEASGKTNPVLRYGFEKLLGK